jgi:hypothetical protein
MFQVLVGIPNIGEGEGGIVIEALSIDGSNNTISCENCYETIPWLHLEDWYTTSDTVFEEDERALMGAQYQEGR